jgi:FAD/FMN-containing dehydrogenase
LDNSVNLAHLLVGSEGTLAYFKSLKLKLARLPKHKVLGVVNFASFYQAMGSAQHIVKLGPTAVELVDRTMIDLSRNNPAFRKTIETALVDANAKTVDAILLVGGQNARCGDAKELVGSAQGGAQHHDEPQGGWQARELH